MRSPAFASATSLLAALVHRADRDHGLAGNLGAMAGDRGLGIGPVGAAFYAWDIGMKRGDIRVLGAASYATPLLSTAFLMLAGFARPRSRSPSPRC